MIYWKCHWGKRIASCVVKKHKKDVFRWYLMDFNILDAWNDILARNKCYAIWKSFLTILKYSMILPWSYFLKIHTFFNFGIRCTSLMINQATNNGNSYKLMYFEFYSITMTEYLVIKISSTCVPEDLPCDMPGLIGNVMAICITQQTINPIGVVSESWRH